MPKPSKDKSENEKDATKNAAKKPAKPAKASKDAGKKPAKPAKTTKKAEPKSGSRKSGAGKGAEVEIDGLDELEINKSAEAAVDETEIDIDATGDADSDDEIVEIVEEAIEVEITEIPEIAAPVAPAAAPATGYTPSPGGFQRRPKPVKPALPANVQEILVARAKYTVTTHSDAIEVSRPRKRDPKNPRTYRFSLKGCEIARRHLAGRRVTLADSANLLKDVKVGELDALDGEARRQATKFLLVALSSRKEAELERDGDLILVHVPFKPVDLDMA